jgi:hypothetical protein
VRNSRSVAVDGRIGGHVPPWFAGRLPGRYGPRLLPICCSTAPTPALRDHNPNRPLASSQLLELESPATCGSSEPLEFLQGKQRMVVSVLLAPPAFPHTLTIEDEEE